MLIIIDAKMPEEAKIKLGEMGELLEVRTHGKTYDAISGHPDVFFCQSPDTLIVSPGLDPVYHDQLNHHKINYIVGKKTPGMKYPASARYNAVVTDEYVIHNKNCSDESILSVHHKKTYINVKQGYCRCSLLHLSNNSFITSDYGIFKTLKGVGFEMLFSEGKGIILPGMSHGFFGGTCGLSENRLLMAGSLSLYSQGEEIREFIKKHGIEITELFDGPLMDVGSIIFCVS